MRPAGVLHPFPKARTSLMPNAFWAASISLVQPDCSVRAAAMHSCGRFDVSAACSSPRRGDVSDWARAATASAATNAAASAAHTRIDEGTLRCV